MDASPLSRKNIFELLRDIVRSYSLGYLYVPLGKCANTEVKRMLWQAHRADGYKPPIPKQYFMVHNFGWKKTAGLEPTPWDHYQRKDFGQFIYDMTSARGLYKFSIVRNPYSRLLSGYKDKILNGPPLTEARLAKFCLPSAPSSFSEFARMVCSAPDSQRDLHWSGQTYKLAADFFDYDYIGHVEHFEEAKLHLANTLGLSFKAMSKPPAHQTNASDSLLEYYDDETAGLIFSTFRRDFEMFGYSEDITKLAPVRERQPTGQYADAILPYRKQIARRIDLPKLLTVDAPATV